MNKMAVRNYNGRFYKTNKKSTQKHMNLLTEPDK